MRRQRGSERATPPLLLFWSWYVEPAFQGLYSGTANRKGASPHPCWLLLTLYPPRGLPSEPSMAVGALRRPPGGVIFFAIHTVDFTRRNPVKLDMRVADDSDECEQRPSAKANAHGDTTESVHPPLERADARRRKQQHDDVHRAAAWLVRGCRRAARGGLMDNRVRTRLLAAKGH